MHDIGSFLKNIADWDTYKTVVATSPLYATSRMIDEKIHECFYDFKHHKNIHKIPSGLYTFTDKWVVPTIVGCNVSILLFSGHEQLRQTSKLFLIGAPFLVCTTNIFKHFCHGEYCLRPLHDRFCKDNQRKRRGFPSTHAAEVVFGTTLYGMQFGIRPAIPLAVVGGLVIFSFIDDNRHYLSQIVAGSGLGVMFALAANKVINKNLSQDVQLHLDVTQHGDPALALSWKF